MSCLALLSTNSRRNKFLFSTYHLIRTTSNIHFPQKPTFRIQSSHVLQKCQSIHTSCRVHAKVSTSQPIKATKIRKERQMNYNHMEWTREQDIKITDMRLEGNGWNEIAEALQLPASSVRQRYMKHLDHALHNGWTPEKIERLNAVVAEGKSWRAIANEFTTTVSACRGKWESENPDMIRLAKLERWKNRRVFKREDREKSIIFRDYGFVMHKRHTWSDHMDSVLINLVNRGLSWRQIGSTIALVPQACYARYKYLTGTKLELGWTPIEPDSSNTPDYLLPSRRFTPPLGSSCTDVNEESSNIDQSPDTKTTTPVESPNENTSLLPNSKNVEDPLGLLGDDFSYDVYNTYPERTWTKEEDETILRDRSLDKHFALIAYDLNLDPIQVYNRYHTVLDPKLKNHVWTTGMTEKLLFYVNQGLSWPLIGNYLGTHRALCKKIYRELTRPADLTMDLKESGGRKSDGVTLDIPSKFNKEQGDGAFDDLRDHESDYADQYLEEDDDNGEDCGNEVDVMDDVINRRKSQNDMDPDVLYEDSDDDDDDDDDNSGPIDINSLQDSEVYIDDPIATGRRSKERRSAAVVSGSGGDDWDQESLLRDIQKTWTPKDETTLIQHVIRNGTRDWDEISRNLDGHHSAEECRAYWKYLDMPLRGYRLPAIKLGRHREKQFWGLWSSFGSNFEEISKRMSSSDSTSDEDQPISPKECEEFFKEKTKRLGMNPDGEVDPEKFQRECSEFASRRIRNLRFEWTKSRSVRLQKLVLHRIRSRDVQVDWVNWKWVARHVGGGATQQKCRIHWRVLREAEARKSEWTPEDIMLLERGVREIGAIFNQEEVDSPGLSSIDQGAEKHVELSISGIRAIQRFYLPHMPVETIQRKYFLLSDKVSRVNVDEYMAIMNAVDEFGDDQWDKVAEIMKSTKSDDDTKSKFTGWTKAPIRRVWESSYKSQILNTRWTPEEDEDLKVTIDRIGQRNWNAVSHFFPGKSGWQCRLRWCQLTDLVQSK